MIHDQERIGPGAVLIGDEFRVAVKMPETSEPHRTGPPAHKAMGPGETSGNVAAPEANTSSATAEASRTTNPLKARKRTKTGCLSRFSPSRDTKGLRSVAHISQHAASGASSAARSARPVRTVSSPSASAKAIFLGSFSKTLSVPLGQLSKVLLLALNIPRIPMGLQTSMAACLQHPWIHQLRRVSCRTESKLGQDICPWQVDR